MRTTLNIDDEIMRRLKHIAADTKRTLTAVVEDQLRNSLVKPLNKSVKVKPFRMITVPGRLIADVDLNCTGALLTFLDREKDERLYGPPRR